MHFFPHGSGILTLKPLNSLKKYPAVKKISIIFDISYYELLTIISHDYLFDTVVKEVENCTKNNNSRKRLLKDINQITF